VTFSAGKFIWAAVAFALAFGVNHQMRPRFVPAYETSESADQLGLLSLADGSLEVPSRAAHLVVQDVDHLGRISHVRELSVRSVNLRGTAPSFELFLTLPENLGLSPGAAGDPRILLQLELVAQTRGRLGAREAFVQREGTRVGRVLTGSWQFTDIREVYDSGQAELRGDARVELQVEHDSGVDLMTGRWSGRVVWQ
jgi:hypothetical protein